MQRILAQPLCCTRRKDPTPCAEGRRGPRPSLTSYLSEFAIYKLLHWHSHGIVKAMEVMPSQARDRTGWPPQSAEISRSHRCFPALTDGKHPGFLRSMRSRWLKIVWKNSKNSGGGRS